MATQALIKQCWMNAYASEEDYIVKVDSMTQAIALRAQCHRWRRAQAEAIYPNCPEDHYLYELEIRISEADFTVTFSRGRDGIVLPPVKGKGGLWCVINRGEDYEISQHFPPVVEPGFISAHSTKAEAEVAIDLIKEERKVKAKGPLFPQEQSILKTD